MNETASWLKVDADSDFSLHNFPFGIARKPNGSTVAVSRLGDTVIDLDALQQHGLLALPGLPDGIFRRPALNDFIALGKSITNPVRERLVHLFAADNAELRDHRQAREQCLTNRQQITMLMPVRVPNYTDFYSSIEHATNVGTMFRDPDNALLPNWKHLPVGYHGRASSIVVSGTPVKRPNGQTKPPEADKPVFGPTRRLDFELEMAFITGRENPLGQPVGTAEAEDYIFGFVLFNDWSARDIQVWEYVPLGPFLAKNFASSISPWIVTLEALEPFRVAGPQQDPPVLPYLQFEGLRNFDIHLEVAIRPEGSSEKVVSRSNFKYMYWNVCQQLAHHTVNGCNLQVGDIYASGTISGPTPDSYGSMLELAWKGTRPLKMPDGSTRSFIEDGDTVIMRGYAVRESIRVGFGEVSTRILPADTPT